MFTIRREIPWLMPPSLDHRSVMQVFLIPADDFDMATWNPAMKRTSFLYGALLLFGTSVLAANPDNVLSLAAGVLRALIAALWTTRRRAVDYHALSQLDDRTLKDIGLSRSDMPWVTDITAARMPALPFHCQVPFGVADNVLLRMRE